MVKPSAEYNKNRSKEIVQAELDSSYALTSFNLTVFNTDEFANGRPNLVSNNVTISTLAELLPQSDIYILPNSQDSHQDHRATFDIAWPLVKNKRAEVWVMNSWPYCQTYANNTANLYVDISDYVTFKQQVLNCYSSYLTLNDVGGIFTYNQYLGLRAKVKFAEAFTIVQKYE